jgi:hypothetical protein
MPRRKPIQKKIANTRKPNNEFKYKRNFDYSCSVPCTNHRCPGFMFLVVSKYGVYTPAVDELECFACKKVRKLGQHLPNREKPKPLTQKPTNTRKAQKEQRSNV